MKLPDGVIVDKTIADEVRFHDAIFVDKIVLASIARTNGALLTQTCTMLFHNGNKFCHPLCPVHEEILHTARNKS